MTAASRHRDVAVDQSCEELSGELIDRVAESVTFRPDPHARAVVIANLTVEIFESIRWLHGSHPDQEELASLYRVLAEAYAHRSRMAARALLHERRPHDDAG